MFQDIKSRIIEPEVGTIISYAAIDGSPEGVANEAAKYQSSDDLNFYGWVEDGRVVGICGFEIHADKVEIHLISVAEDRQRQGVGSAMVNALQAIYPLPLEAETVEEVVGFYRKRGFETTSFPDPEWGKKFTCVLKAASVTTTIIETPKAKIAVVHSDAPIITDAGAALDLAATLFYEHECQNIAINKAAITEDFFKLSTGVAGEIVQKLVNYRYRLAIIGDFSGYTSKPLHDYIYECNKGKHLYFVGSEEAAIEKLRVL